MKRKERSIRKNQNIPLKEELTLKNNPEIQLVKKIASISERAEKRRVMFFPGISKFYKV